jgi:hypothetical protein
MLADYVLLLPCLHHSPLVAAGGAFIQRLHGCISGLQGSELVCMCCSCTNVPWLQTRRLHSLVQHHILPDTHDELLGAVPFKHLLLRTLSFTGAGRHDPAVPRSKRLLSDAGSNILVRLSTRQCTRVASCIP